MKRYYWTYQCQHCFIKSGYGFTGTTSEALDNAPSCCNGEQMHPVQGIEVRIKEYERCGAYAECWEELGKPKGWLGCSLPKGHEGNHKEE